MTEDRPSFRRSRWILPFFGRRVERDDHVSHLDWSSKRSVLLRGFIPRSLHHRLLPHTARILQDAWFALWSGFVAAYPTVELRSDPGIERLRQWVLDSACGNGVDFVLKRLKSISKYMLWLGSASDTPMPAIPTGTLGRCENGLRLPWLAVLCPDLHSYIHAQLSVVSKVRLKNQFIKRLTQWSKFGRALPPLSEKKSVEAALAEHEEALFDTPSVVLPKDRVAFRNLFSGWLKEQGMKAPSKFHYSFSASASLETTRKAGGRLSDAREILERWKGKTMRDIFAIQDIPPFWTKAPYAFVDPLGIPLACVDRGFAEAYPDNLYNAQTDGIVQELGLDPATDPWVSMAILWGSIVECTAVELPLPLFINPSGPMWGPEEPGESRMIRKQRELYGCTSKNPWFRDLKSYSGQPSISLEPLKTALRCKVVALPEWGAKLRVVTKGSTPLAMLSHLGRSFLYGLLSTCNRSTASNHFTMWHWVKYRCPHLERGKLLLSSDFTTYTDKIPLWIAEEMVSAIVEEFEPVWWVAKILRFSFLPRYLTYGDEESGVTRIHQQRGLLMGDPMTYSLGSFLNLFLIDLAKQNVPFSNFSDINPEIRWKRTIALVQNDDLIAVVSRAQAARYAHFSEHIVGLKLSTVNFLSERFGTFCEEIAIVEKGYRPLTSWNPRERKSYPLIGRSGRQKEGRLVKHVDQLKVRHFGRVSSVGMFKPSDVSAILTRGSAASSMLMYHDEKSSVYKSVASLHHLIFGEEYKEFRSDIPIYLASQVGGLSVPHRKGFAFVWRKRCSTRFKNLVKYLSSDDVSPEGIHVASLLSGITSPTRRGWAGQPRWQQLFKFVKEHGEALQFNELMKQLQPEHLDLHGVDSPNWTFRRAGELFLKEKGYVPLVEVMKDLTRGITFSDAIREPPELSPVRIRTVVKRLQEAHRIAKADPKFGSIVRNSKFVPQSNLEIIQRLSHRLRWYWVAPTSDLLKIGSRVGANFSFEVDRKTGLTARYRVLDIEHPYLAGLIGIDSLLGKV